MYRKYVKRMIDVLVSASALLVLSPLLLVVMVLLHFSNEGAGVFFFQERPGLKGKIFRIFKFKTMTDRRDAEGRLLPDADRLTRVGRFLRASSIDELPQLFNVLRGDMSLIGPRPLLVRYLPLYSKEQARRHDVRPGITGWAQVHGRNAISWAEKFRLDVWYVDHCSFALDLRIIFLSVWKVLAHEGISQEGQTTMTPFTGNNDKVYLYGASGHAKVITDILVAMGLDVAGYVDDNSQLQELMGRPVHHGVEACLPVIISIGDNRTRKRLAESLSCTYVTAIHPSAVLSPSATVGEGSVVMQGAVVQADARIGRHCIVNTAASVDHECVLADYVQVSPHATLCGNVHVGEGAWVAAGAVVLPGVHIGSWSVIGAGAVVLHDVPDHVVMVGNPARMLHETI